MPRKAQSSTIRLSGLRKAEAFDLRPDDDARRAMAERLGLLTLKKVTFTGTLSPSGAADVRLSGHLGATVVQPCSVTLAPVTTRIEEDVERLYLAEMPEMPDGDEIEMPSDADVEELPETLDLALVMEEALSLALPMFPRADDAESPVVNITEPGKAALTDDDLRPFASLAEFREKLVGDDG